MRYKIILAILLITLVWLCIQIVPPVTAGIMGYFDKTQNE